MVDPGLRRTEAMRPRPQKKAPGMLTGCLIGALAAFIYTVGPYVLAGLTATQGLLAIRPGVLMALRRHC